MPYRKLVKQGKDGIIAEKVILLKQMEGIRVILAANIKENRRKLGWTQEKLAEQAGMSTHYIAMIETCNKYPKPEMLERLAKALNVESHQLFNAPTAPDEALEHLRHSIITDMKQIMPDMNQIITDVEQAVGKAVKQAFAEECKSKDKI